MICTWGWGSINCQISQSLIFGEKSGLPRRTQNCPKSRPFCLYFCIYTVICCCCCCFLIESFALFENGWKWKNKISPHILRKPYQGKMWSSSFRPKLSWPIRLQIIYMIAFACNAKSLSIACIVLPFLLFVRTAKCFTICYLRHVFPIIHHVL